MRMLRGCLTSTLKWEKDGVKIRYLKGGEALADLESRDGEPDQRGDH